MDQYIEWHCSDLVLQNLRPNSIAQRSRVLYRLDRALGGKHLLDAVPRDLADFLSRPLKPESRATETTHVRRFYQWCVEEEHLEVSPARKLRRPRTPKRLPRPMNQADKELAIELAPPRIKPWLLLAAHAGLRACEVAPLEASDIWWQAPVPLIIVAEGKGGHAGSIEMSPYLSEQLQLCRLPLSGYLFPRYDGQPGDHTPAYRVSQVANQYLHGIGITDTFHSLRHWFGTEVMRSSNNIRTAQEALRHGSIRSTELYTYVDRDDVMTAVSSLPTPSVGHDERKEVA